MADRFGTANYNSDVFKFSKSGTTYTEGFDIHGSRNFGVADDLDMDDPNINNNLNMSSLDVTFAQKASTAAKYTTVGNHGSFDGDDGSLKFAERPYASGWGWDADTKTGLNGSGEIKTVRSYSNRYTFDYWGTGDEVFSDAVYSGGEWTMDLTIGGTSTYTMKFTDAYNATNYPGQGGDDSSGLPFVWYDDYYLYNDLGYTGTNLDIYSGVAPTTYGEAGRWVLVREEMYIDAPVTSAYFGKVHGADVCAEAQVGGETVETYFEHAWKLGGTMLGMEFWDDDPDYYWSNMLGTVAEATFTTDASLVRLTNNYQVDMPVYEWNGSAWVLPDDAGDILTVNYIWGLPDHDVETSVAGYDKLNNFLRYVMDIDALVVEDVDGDGTFDVGEDYILFSLTDDGSWSKMRDWGSSTTNAVTSFDGEYFDGNVVFLYDGNTVTTWFAPYNATSGTAIFFGQGVSTTVATLMAGAFGDFEIDTLDIGYIPEPSTIVLMLGSASGLAVAAGVLRRRVR
jgi:hypothetical protein